MTFNDIFKSGFLESVTDFSVTDTLLGMLCALILGLFIFLVYKKTSPGILYSTSFGLTLIGLSLVTTLVIMAVTSNVILWAWSAHSPSFVSARRSRNRLRSYIFFGRLLPASWSARVCSRSRSSAPPSLD